MLNLREFLHLYTALNDYSINYSDDYSLDLLINKTTENTEIT